MYGQTEASPRISHLPWKFLPKKIGSIGKGLSGYKIFLVDENMRLINYTNRGLTDAFLYLTKSKK